MVASKMKDEKIASQVRRRKQPTNKVLVVKLYHVLGKKREIVLSRKSSLYSSQRLNRNLLGAQIERTGKPRGRGGEHPSLRGHHQGIAGATG